MTTIMSMSGAGLVATALLRSKYKFINLSTLLNAILSGGIAICAGADRIEPWAALLIGMFNLQVEAFKSRLGCISAFSYLKSADFIKSLQIDDACNAISVHYTSGLVGVLLAPFFEIQTGILYAWVKRKFLFIMLNLKLKDTFAFKRLGYHILAAVVITIWSGVNCLILFSYLKRKKLLRVPHEAELAGLDSSEHGTAAYAIT